MRHIEKARNAMEKSYDAHGKDMFLMNFIQLENVTDIKGVAPIVKFTIQSDPIGEVGINGVQATDMLEYVKFLFESLNDAFPSHYNETTIAHIENAIQAQHLRTADRIRRNVEGKNEA